jgi:hypothetical protein
MSFNGSGTFQINTAGQPVVAGTTITATAFNALTADLATGLSTCMTKDGQTVATGNIPMGNNRITGMGAGTAATDAANLTQVQTTAAKLLTVSGTDTITASGTPTVAAYTSGAMYYFSPAATNTGAVTINIDSLGAKNITKEGSTALAAGDLTSGKIAVIVYDGTRFQLVNAGASSSTGNITFAGNTVSTSNTNGNVAFTPNGSGAVLVGTTSSIWASANNQMEILGGTGGVKLNPLVVKTPLYYTCTLLWNATTTDDPVLLAFGTESSYTVRGNITYNRSGGVIAYNTTSDYRLKDVYGPVTDSGEKIDAIKIYRGKMHGATLERPMAIAHELAEQAPYAVTGKKDGVHPETGEPMYQQVDYTTLVPLLVAEIQSLRARVAALEAK